MITKEQAVKTAKDYLKLKNRKYISVEEQRVSFTKAHITAPEGEEDFEMDVAVVGYLTEGYQAPIAFFIVVDSETGEVLFTRGPHGILEDRE